MRRRRRGTRYIESWFLRALLSGALLIWMGAIVVAVLHYQAPAGLESADEVAPPPAQAVAEREPRRRAAAPPPDAPTVADSRGGQTQAGTRSAKSNPDRQEPSRDRPRPETEADDVEDRADMAQLETGPESDVAPDTTPDRVPRAQFTTGIVEREPINRVEAVFSINGEVYSTDGRPLRALYYFTEVEGMRGETVTHRWEHEGEVVAQTSFDVEGDPWPVYSRQDLAPALAGDWQVVVIDASGKVITTDQFSYQSY
jgi:hypothetical protein